MPVPCSYRPHEGPKCDARAHEERQSGKRDAHAKVKRAVNELDAMCSASNDDRTAHGVRP